MSCSDAQVVPITVDGVEVFERPATCDRPSALTGTCETGERIAARYEGTHARPPEPAVPAGILVQVLLVVVRKSIYFRCVAAK